MVKNITLTIFALLGLANFAAAQADEQSQTVKNAEAAIRQIPLVGNKPEDFVPAGWEIHTRAEGDLNGDQLTDFAFNITMMDEPNDGSICHDVAIVLFAETGGKLRRVGLNDNLPDNGFCTKQAISIKNGIVISSTNFGNNSANDLTFRFRYDRAANALMLIGFDWESYKRSGNDDGFIVSYNLLTGIKQATTNYNDRSPNPKEIYGKQTVKRSPTPRLKIKFDDAGYDLKNGIGIPVDNRGDK